MIIKPIDDKGYGGEQRMMNFFEWKYDWPGTLDEYVKSDKEKREHAYLGS